MPIGQTANTYQSYLLRLWRDDQDAPWRVSLQSTRDGRQHFFTDLEEAWRFLRQRTGAEGGWRDGTAESPG